MAEFSVLVKPVLEVYDHPNADRLSIVKIDGYNCISAKLEDGSHRYSVNDMVVYIPEGSVVPEWLLKKMDFWKDNKGTLSSSGGNRVKAIRLRQIFSQGILYEIGSDKSLVCESETHFVDLDQDVASLLGITKYEPIVPASMAGSVAGDIRAVHKFDIDSLQSKPYMFDDGDEVVVTEKLHGTHCRISYIPDMNNENFFYDGNVCIASKGLGAQGLVFKKENDNVYTQALSFFIEDLSAMAKLKELANNGPVHILGEVFGIGVQDLGYGMSTKQFRVFAIKINNDFVPYDVLVDLTKTLGLEMVPIMYHGPFIKDKMVELRDGPTHFNVKQIREGIVITTKNGDRHPRYGYKMAKFVSPDYLLRKGNTTEFS